MFYGAYDFGNKDNSGDTFNQERTRVSLPYPNLFVNTPEIRRSVNGIGNVLPFTSLKICPKSTVFMNLLRAPLVLI